MVSANPLVTTAVGGGRASHASPTLVPGVVIAGSGSSTGKTTVATGLMAALAKDRTVAPFKVGPDFIDPSYHAIATGRPGRNLDSFLCGRELIGPLYAHGCAGAEISVVEGVMGLFDGRIATRSPEPGDREPGEARFPGSTAEIAGLIGLPIVLVLGVRGVSATAGAIIHGLSTFDPGVHVAGVILNNVGSTRHVAACTRAIEETGIPVVGAIPRVKDIAVPSRHLGLITAEESGAAAEQAVARMGEIVANNVDLDALTGLSSVSYSGPAWSPTVDSPVHGRVRIALAAGPAFTFVYSELPEVLEAAGAQVIPFDPLTEQLPKCDGLIIPGGFPEEHVEPLSANTRLLHHIHDEAARGMPVYAECAGLLTLCASLDGKPMAGVIPRNASMTGRLTLGYRQAHAESESVLFAAGETVAGHEFHHTSLVPQEDTSAVARTSDAVSPAWGWETWQGDRVTEGFVTRNVHASYLHTHPAATKNNLGRFVSACWRFGHLAGS